MTNSELIGLIADSRRSLERSYCYVGDTIPWGHLWDEQLRLERATSGQLGFIVPALIAGGMAVAAIAAWAWKHHEDTKALELRAKCVDDLMSSGRVSREQAISQCYGSQVGITGDIELILKYTMIAGLLFGSIWVFSKLR